MHNNGLLKLIRCLRTDGVNDETNIIDSSFFQSFFQNQGRDPITNPLVFSVCLAFKGFTLSNIVDAQLFGNVNSSNLVGLDICSRINAGSNFCAGLRAVGGLRLLKFVNANFSTGKNFVVITYNGSRTAAGINISVNNATPITSAVVEEIADQSTASTNTPKIGVFPSIISYRRAIVYDRILTPSEITAFNEDKIPSSPTRHWNFDKTVNFTVLEEIARNNAVILGQVTKNLVKW